MWYEGGDGLWVSRWWLEWSVKGKGDWEEKTGERNGEGKSRKKKEMGNEKFLKEGPLKYSFYVSVDSLHVAQW